MRGLIAAAAVTLIPRSIVEDQRHTMTDQTNNNVNSLDEHTAPASEDWKVQRDACKFAGDQAFQSSDYTSAIQHYSSAISLDPDLCVAYSNRSAAYLKTNQKSKALQDANKCVELGSMGAKGISRLAAALQSLGRWQAALDNWNKVLESDANNAAATRGLQDCQEQLDKLRAAQAAVVKDEQQDDDAKQTDDAVTDDLDDFFNDVEDATTQVKKEKELAAQPQATDAIKKQKKALGSAKEQIDRLLKENYKWFNLNPFYVLDVPHTATPEEISRRYKGLSLLLHPDKNRAEPRAQEAYDEVLKAKAMLDDENKANHCRQLIEKGMIRGQADWEDLKRHRLSNQSASLEECQSKAVHRIFADIENKRREVERRERQYEQRTQQQEDEEEQKGVKDRKFDKEWKQEERVDKRIGNWRDFNKKAKLV